MLYLDLLVALNEAIDNETFNQFDEVTKEGLNKLLEMAKENAEEGR